MELTARLQHPGIVRVLKSDEATTGRPCFAMDYVDGVSLRSWLLSSQPDIPAIVCLFIELCEVVEHAHRCGVIHRDLKPGNVPVDREAKPHVLNFGLSKKMDQAGAEKTGILFESLPGGPMGTLCYLSREQVAGTHGEVDVRTDVYVLGVMLFEVVTGSLPFGTANRHRYQCCRLRCSERSIGRCP